MTESSGLALMGLGFVLGLKHATDADHIVAVTTLLGKERRLLRSCWIGAFWGVGHTFALMVAGLFVVLLKTPISENTAVWLETAVAVMLVVLGGRVSSILSQTRTRSRRIKPYPLAPGCAGYTLGSLRTPACRGRNGSRCGR